MLKAWEQRLNPPPEDNPPRADDTVETAPAMAEPVPEPMAEPVPEPPLEPVATVIPHHAALPPAEPAPAWTPDPLHRLLQHFRRERLHHERRYTRLGHRVRRQDHPAHTRLGQHPDRALERTIWRRRRWAAAWASLPPADATPASPPPATRPGPKAPPPAATAPKPAVPGTRRPLGPLLLAGAGLVVAAAAAWWWWQAPAPTPGTPAPGAPTTTVPVRKPAAPAAPVRLTTVDIGNARDAAGAEPGPLNLRLLDDALRFGTRGVRLDAAATMLDHTALKEPARFQDALNQFRDTFLTPPPASNDAPGVVAAWRQEETRWLSLQARSGNRDAQTSLVARAAGDDPLAARLAAAQLIPHTPGPVPSAWIELFRDPAACPAPGTNTVARVFADAYASAYAALYRKDVPGSLDMLTAGARSDAFGGELAAACLRAIGQNLGRAAAPEVRGALRAWEARIRSADVPGLPGSPSLAHLNTSAILHTGARELLRSGDEDEERMMREYLAAPWKETKVRSLIELGQDRLPVARRPLISLMLDDPSTWDLAVERLARDVKLAAISAADARDLKVLAGLWTDPDDEVRHRAAIRWREVLPPPGQTVPVADPQPAPRP